MQSPADSSGIGGANGGDLGDGGAQVERATAGGTSIVTLKRAGNGCLTESDDVQCEACTIWARRAIGPPVVGPLYAQTSRCVHASASMLSVNPCGSAE
eukprot:3941175-Prymnesium_polylepis.1